MKTEGKIMSDEKENKDDIILFDKEELEKRLNAQKLKKPISSKIKEAFKIEPPSCYMTGPTIFDDDVDKHPPGPSCYAPPPRFDDEDEDEGGSQ
jgi:hypothetical protein